MTSSPGNKAALTQALDRFEQSTRDAMRAALAESRRDDANAAGEVHDLGDESVIDELLSVNAALAERHGRELQQIEAARRRLADGSIGRCADCDNAISVERLLANPVATRCITCESSHERAHGQPAPARL